MLVANIKKKEKPLKHQRRLGLDGEVTGSRVTATIPLLSQSEISSLLQSVAIQPGLTRTRAEPAKTGFFAMCRVFPDSRLRVSDSQNAVWDSQLIILRVLQDS